MRIREVGPRDGFQNEPEVIPTDDKVRLIELLAATGLKRIEVTSFVRADVIPQLADGAEVLAAVEVPDDVSVSVLIPNERGLENALAQRERFDEINVFLSASGDPQPQERQPLGRGVADGARGSVSRARARSLRCEGVISVSFGCPYEGDVAPGARVRDRPAPGRRGRRGDRLRRHDRDGQPAPGARVLRGARERRCPASS